MKFKRITALLCSFTLAASLAAGCSSSGQPSGESKSSGSDPIVLKLADVNSDSSMFHLGLEEIAKSVNEKTGGRIIIEVHANGELGDTTEVTNGVQLGTIDMAITNSATLASIVPEFAVLDAPFVIVDDAHAGRVANGEVGKYFEEKLTALHINTVGWFCGGSRNIFSTKEIKTVDDLKGLKIRTMENSVHMDTFNAIGAIATPMAYSELFNALQQGTVDAGENAIDNILTANFYEVAPYVALTGHFYNFLQVIISDQALTKIPDDLKDAFYAGCEEGTKNANDLIQKQNAASQDELVKMGVTFHELDHDALVEKVSSVFDKYSDTMPDDLVQKIKDAQ